MEENLFNEIIKSAALEYARANAIVMPGDYEGGRGGWGKCYACIECMDKWLRDVIM